MYRHIYALLFIWSCCSCEQKKSQDGEQFLDSKKNIDTTLKPIVKIKIENPAVDQMATFISGIRTNDTAFANLQRLTAWKSYSAISDSVWKSVEKNRLSAMRNWANEEFGNVSISSDTLFYPFSGPDFLNAYTLFPHVHTYILVALEPIGQLPTFPVSDTKKWAQYLVNLNNSLQDVYKKSYFITKRMNEQLENSKVNGTLPLLAVFLKQTGHTLSSIKTIGIDSSGNLLEIPFDTSSGAKKRPRGVKLEFFKVGEEQMKSLYYFSADLGDGALANQFKFRHCLDKLGSFNAYVKSASYLMHYEEFSIIRNHLLGKANLLLQDDTGIAFRFIDSKNWNVQLYGQYIPPVKDFSKKLYQQDLVKRYSDSSSNVKELPFTLGYHWGSKKNSLMVVVRK